MPLPPNQPNIQRLANMAMREMLRTMVQTEARPLSVAERLAVKLRIHRPLIRLGLMKPLRVMTGPLSKFGKDRPIPPGSSETIKFRRWLQPNDAPLQPSTPPTPPAQAPTEAQAPQAPAAQSRGTPGTPTR